MIKIDLNEDVLNFIEALYYEVDMRKDILTHALRMDKRDTTSFVAFEEEYKDFYIMYRTAMAEIENTYVLPVCPNRPKWFIDFLEGAISVKEDIDER